MIKKSVFENDLITGMHTELCKQASAPPDLVKAAECLHSALEILESQGLSARAHQVLQILEKISQEVGQLPRHVQEIPSLTKLMELGLTQRDLMEFSKGNPIAKAKLNLMLRKMGLSEHQIGKFLGPHNIMSEKDAKELVDPNRTFGKMWEWMKDPIQPIDPAHPTTEENIHRWLQDPTVPVDPNNPQPDETVSFKSQAQKKPAVDKHTKGLTPEKMVANLKHHGTEFNLSDDLLFHRPSKLTKENMDPELADLLDVQSFDIDASDDELMGMEVKDDSLEVFEADVSDFEDERDA